MILDTQENRHEGNKADVIIHDRGPRVVHAPSPREFKAMIQPLKERYGLKPYIEHVSQDGSAYGKFDNEWEYEHEG
jgi:hypothetical protein